MKIIPINSPVDYFQLTTTFDQDVWSFTFRWNETFGLFHINASLNRSPIIMSVAVLGGVFVLKNFELGYNFVFFGTATKVEDLGNTMQMYQITTSEAENLELIRNAGD